MSTYSEIINFHTRLHFFYLYTLSVNKELQELYHFEVVVSCIYLSSMYVSRQNLYHLLQVTDHIKYYWGYVMDEKIIYQMIKFK